MAGIWYFQPRLTEISDPAIEAHLSRDVRRWFRKVTVRRNSRSTLLAQFEIEPEFLQTHTEKVVLRLGYRVETLAHIEREDELSCEIGTDDRMMVVTIPNPEQLAIRKIRFVIAH